MGPEIMLIALVLAVGWSIALVLKTVSQRGPLLPMVGAILCLPITVFCLYGLCASFEPGVGLGWKIGYASMASLFVAAAIAQSVCVFKTRC